LVLYAIFEGNVDKLVLYIIINVILWLTLIIIVTTSGTSIAVVVVINILIIPFPEEIIDWHGFLQCII
jgi:Na+/H+ antiporter NhaA